jgi:LysR family transcriptional activator of mexEF-oprN operon
LPALLGVFARVAPRLRVISIPVNFRTAGEALATQRLDAAVTVADELPPGIRREPLYRSEFVCLLDPRHARVGRLREADYFAHEHVVVSYNGDLRGVVEDALHKQRTIRCSVSTFANLGALLDGSALLATVPDLVAHHIRRIRPHLQIRRLPFALAGGAAELLWPRIVDDDEPCRFARERIAEVARGVSRAARRREGARAMSS